MTISASPLAKAILYLEDGDWQAAHTIVQRDSSPLGCWAHGIAHLMEGDLDNAHYWYRRAHRVLPNGAALHAEIAALRHRLESESHEVLIARSASTERAMIKRDRL